MSGAAAGMIHPSYLQINRFIPHNKRKADNTLLLVTTKTENELSKGESASLNKLRNPKENVNVSSHKAATLFILIRFGPSVT